MATRTMTTSSNAQPATIPGGVPTPRIYKTHLTPFLHRAFLSAALLALGPCYISAILMSPYRTLWSLNPIGMTGLRTFLLFVPVLAVFIIRVMNLHVGKRTTTSMAETLYIQVAASGIQTAATVGWYAFSAWMFGEVYIWSRSREADLGWVDMGIAGYERPTVNENPILLRSVFVILAVGQAALHLARDYDRIPIAETEDRAGQVQAEEMSRLPEPIHLLAQQLRPITGKVARLVIPGIVFSIPIYFMFIRRPAWDYLAYPIARVLVRQLPPNNGPTAIMHPLTLLWQTLTASTILVVLWELSNAIFTIHVSRPPLKRGQPLTSEVKDASGVVLSRSRDPNGSLIRGLKAKKDVPRAFAFWELYLICTDPCFETRRKSIFADVDRKPLSSWQEISSLCLAEITAISTRIRVAQEPSAPASQQQKIISQQQQQQQQQSTPPLGLPRIARQSVLNDRAVVLPGRGGSARGGASQALAAVGSVAKSIGQSPTLASGARKGSVAEYSRQAIEYGINKASNNTLLSGWQSRTVDFLRTPLGEPFRRTFARTVRAVVLGVPFSNGVDLVHASKSLTALAVVSLKEDNFGQAQRDIVSTIRVYASSVISIRNLIAGLPAHWTDVYFEGGQRDVSRSADGNGELDEVRVILEVLRQGLEELVLAFGEYAEGLGLGKAEMRTVREIIGAGGQKRGTEMGKVG
ncbi:hypothetical protein LTR91_002114 [Friedmanniomyces endolithicus]|uniref:Nucleoporin NDC1 n=1 Tax=Friedmanniomyces endolithicus TaxID=329885 RepID=A0AAN6L0H5_9PEZI|nr:hypothetical protein LTR57_004018 [Friedmanniomyces endolithicus]KAK1011643.1 hypothetical protein LTR91_002114 [Friedmanniomyces endolithicus]KAK1054911.1 hypothetical protein LTS16_000557 [Friedmanniomyces endolithicus]